MEAIPLHVLPADQLFRLYVQDSSGTRIVLWFKCGNNGDLVTKPLSSGRHVFEAKGKFDTGTFHATSEPEKISLTGVEKRDHLHLTYHPSIKEPTPVLNGPGCRKNAPRFDLTKLTKLEEVAVHLLASPGRYSVEKAKNQYHAIINNAYGFGGQPKVIFWVAPLDRQQPVVPDALIVPGCFLYARCSPQRLSFDVLLQVQQTAVPYSRFGDMHIMAAPISEESETVLPK